jgi:hypothetical protein
VQPVALVGRLRVAPLQLAALGGQFGRLRMPLAQLRLQLAMLRLEPRLLLLLQLARPLCSQALLLARVHLVQQRVLGLLLLKLVCQLGRRVLQLLHHLERARLLRTRQGRGGAEAVGRARAMAIDGAALRARTDSSMSRADALSFLNFWTARSTRRSSEPSDTCACFRRVLARRTSSSSLFRPSTWSLSDWFWSSSWVGERGDSVSSIPTSVHERCVDEVYHTRL